MNTMTQMARTYRNMCKQVQHQDAHIREAKAKLHALSKARNQTIQELEYLRTLMEYCVITGEEPTQAKLSHTVEQMNNTISEHRRHMRMDDFYYTPSGSTVTISTTGLSSLLGAQGATGAYGVPGVTASISTSSSPYVSVTSTGSSLLIQDELDLLQNTNTPIP